MSGPTYEQGSPSSRYVPEGYSTPNNGPPYPNGDKASPRQNVALPEAPRPYNPPNPEQYSATPSYRVPLDDRPANPDVQALQVSEGYGGSGRPRTYSGSSHLSARSHHSGSHHSQNGSRPSHDGRRPSPDGRRLSHASHHSHKSRHSTAAHSHHSRHSHHGDKAAEEPYRTESEREEYIKGLKRINSKRPTLGGSMFAMWDKIKESLK